MGAVIACVTVSMAVLESPENADAKVPSRVPGAVGQVSSPHLFRVVAAGAAGRVGVVGRPGGSDATGVTPGSAAAASGRSSASVFSPPLAVPPEEGSLEAERRRAAPKDAICLVFGSRCGEALRVARCESRFDTNAQNGQYLGLFQMGSWERRAYGHGATAYAQAVAAHRYFVASGSDWSPWQCKPWW